jgi:hypothetical protein
VTSDPQRVPDAGSLGPWSDAIPFGRLPSWRGADSAALIEEPPNPEP